MKWVGSLFFSCALLLSCGGSGLSSPGYYTISGVDPGGSILAYVAKYQALSAAGVSVKVDGICISACTILLGVFPEDRICMTARASFGFHEASNDNTPDPEATKAWARYLYPKWVQEWIAKTGGLAENPRFMFPEDAKGHIPLCAGESYTDVDPNKVVPAAPDEEEGQHIIFKPNK